MILSKLLNIITQQSHAEREAELYRNLIRHEARIGGRLFGPVDSGVRREFFCLDKHTWVWHEEWTDKQGERQIRTTRYDVRPNGILKAQDGHYTAVSKAEGKRLIEAIRLYDQQVNAELYSTVA